MLFLLFGGGIKITDKGPGDERSCPRCHNTATWRRLRRCHQLTFFFVPVLRWGRRQLEACPVCGETLELPVQRRSLRQLRSASA